MRAIEAEIELSRLRVRIERVRLAVIRKNGRNKEPSMKLPKLQGVGHALGALQHALEARAEKFLQRIARTDGEGAAVFERAHAKLDAAAQSLLEVDGFLAALDRAGDNGAPTSGGSSEPSAPAANEPDPKPDPDPQPQAGWKAP